MDQLRIQRATLMRALRQVVREAEELGITTPAIRGARALLDEYEARSDCEARVLRLGFDKHWLA